MNNYIWKPIHENPIVVDFGSCFDADEVHIILKDAFGFPDNYGENWSAFEDYLDDFFHSETSGAEVHIQDFYSLSSDLQKYCSLMLEIMDDIQRKYPGALFTIIS